MPRLLTAARATVPPHSRARYQELMARLAQRLEARGQHCWLFELRNQPGTFVEFAEGKAEAGHRSVGPIDEVEQEIENELLTLAQYDHSREEVWQAVDLARPEGG